MISEQAEREIGWNLYNAQMGAYVSLSANVFLELVEKARKWEHATSGVRQFIAPNTSNASINLVPQPDGSLKIEP